MAEIVFKFLFLNCLFCLSSTNLTEGNIRKKERRGPKEERRGPKEGRKKTTEGRKKTEAIWKFSENSSKIVQGSVSSLERNDKIYLNDSKSTFQSAPRKCAKLAYPVWLPNKNKNFFVIRIKTATTICQQTIKRKKGKHGNELGLVAVD